ncbi:MAG: nuoN 2, partial [Spartobacteria bacterium]|nr:nuoN 2 [Spartobacteria bacterium]
SDFSGLFSDSPLLATCMAVFMLSLAGLPPLAGFFGKFYLFSAALRTGEDHGLLWLVAIALFGSLISLYYYLTVLKVIFLDRPSPSGTVIDPHQAGFAFSIGERVALCVAAGTVLLLGIMPGLLISRIVGSLPVK